MPPTAAIQNLGVKSRLQESGSIENGLRTIFEDNKNQGRDDNNRNSHKWQHNKHNVCIQDRDNTQSFAVFDAIRGQ